MMYRTNKKMVHFLDAVLFTEIFIKSFQKISENSSFYILSSGAPNAQYSQEKNVFFVDPSNKKLLDEAIQRINLDEPDAAFFHYLNPDKEYISSKISQKTKQIWCLWGHDLYDNNAFFPYDQYEEKTQEYLKNTKPELKKFYNSKISKLLMFRILLMTKKIGARNKTLDFLYKKYSVNRYETIKRFHAISYIVPKEKEILKKIFSGKLYLHLYSDPDFPFFSHFETRDNGKERKNILVGNSAAFSNNHLDCFEILKKFSLKDSKLIVPLSYGGDQKYVDEVVEKGKKMFGEKFYPLTQRLPLDEYSQLLDTCGIAIMNQKRQQSGGNLFHLIGSGIQVYMNKENGFYSYFKENGLKVFDIENLSQEEIDHIKYFPENKEALLKLYSKEHYEKELSKLINILN